MSNKPFISIVIPVYNAEAFLNQCIDSILSQRDTFSEFELILVDDGSKDSSGAICDSYAKDPAVRVFHLENGGPSRARNLGVRNATGDYILFIDSDDYIASGSLANIARCAKEQHNPDVVLLMARKFTDAVIDDFLEEPYDESRIIGASREDVLAYFGERAKFPASPCTKLLRRAYIHEQDVFFKEGQKMEDLEWAMHCMLSAQSFGCYNGDHYYYRQAKEGTNATIFTDEVYRDVRKVLSDWVDAYNSEQDARIKSTLLRFTCYEYLILLSACTDYISGDIEWHRQMSSLLDTQSDGKSKLVRIVIKCFGVKNASRLLRAYVRYRAV